MEERYPCMYSIVRYVHDTAKDEPVNVGVLIEGPQGALMGRFPDDLRRVSRLPVDTDFRMLSAVIHEMWDAISHRLRDEQSGTIGDTLDRWAAEYCSRIQITRPRASMPCDLERELDRLYGAMITETEEVQVAPVARSNRRLRAQVRRYLRHVFRTPREYQSMVRESYVAEGKDWPGITADFAFRNGRVSLASVISLEARSQRAVEDRIKVSEANLTDLLETDHFDQQHLITIIQPAGHETETLSIAERILGRVSTIYHATPIDLLRFADHVRDTADPWTH